MACPVIPSFTLSVHVVLDVTWDARGFATTAGSGKVHIWNRTKLTTNGTNRLSPRIESPVDKARGMASPRAFE